MTDLKVWWACHFAVSGVEECLGSKLWSPKFAPSTKFHFSSIIWRVGKTILVALNQKPRPAVWQPPKL
eukprot:4791843-Amphidinium_carterae.2